MRFRKLFLLTALVPLSLFVQAKNGKDGKSEPAVLGSVADASTKKPVQGVTVSISCAKGEKEVITDASGNFKIPQICAGEVTIILEKKGYKTFKKEGVVLKEGMSIKMNFDMKVEGDDEVFHPLLRMMDGE
ncbi:MAG TPA: carboxypeptidase-like regulatory domain-containing protein [Flavitalea sp.]|nr:carboxypeptidase-like regulatory domain-containing protein [Flavitalea sp.]